MNTALLVLSGSILLATGGRALAKDTPQSVTDEARKLAGKGETLKAAERFGEAVALAQAAGDIEAEQAVAEAMDQDLIGSTSRGTDLVKLAPLLAAAMRKMDADRCGACVSAPVLARSILQIATETGDFASVADAAAVAALHASKKNSGQAAAVVAKYAEGLKAVAEGRHAAATTVLDAAAAEAAKAGWMDLAARAATEAAAAWMKTGAPDKATTSLAAIASLFDRDSAGAATVFAALVRTRLAAAPPGVRKPVEDLAAKFPGGVAGGGSAPGGRPGSVQPIRNTLHKFPKGKPIVTVTARAGGWEIEWPTSKKPVNEMRIHTQRVVEEGGLSLTLHGRRVAFRRIDLGVGQGVAMGSDAIRAYYLVADGETWGMSKDGVVTITR